MTKRKSILLVLVPIILVGGIYTTFVVGEFSHMRMSAPDGKGRTAADYEAGLTETCVTTQFVKGGWAYPCTKNQQIKLAFENAAFEMSLLPLLLLVSVASLSR